MNQTDKLVVHKLKKIAIISLIFMSIQILGGALAHSIAIMADAFHLLSDVIAYVISLYAVLLSTKQAPKYLTFGYQKAQPLGALINVAIIWCVTVELFIEATHRIISQEVVQQPLFMLVTSVFGLGCNLFIMKTLHSGDGHGHGCGHDHGHNHNHSHGHDHSHDHHQHQHQLDDHSNQDELKNKSLLNGYVQAVCSCTSQGQIMKNKQLNDSPLQLNLQMNNNIKNQKHKGYCALHTSQNNNKTNKHINNNNNNNNHQHSHDDHQDHSYHQKSQKPQFQNINMQAAYIHILSDIILSIGVIVSASIIYFVCGQDKQWSYWQLADPFCTYLFSVVALYSTISIIKQSIVLLLDGCEDKNILKKVQYIKRKLEDKNKGVKIGQVKLWSSNRGKHYMAVKISNKCKHNHGNENKHINQHNQHKHINDRQTMHSQQQYQQIDHVYEAFKNFCQKQKITSFIEKQQNYHHH